jgi:hypothetical protein
MNVLMIRAKVSEESVPEVEAGVGKMFAAIEAAQPKVRYASCKLPDGITYLVLLQLEEGTTDNPLAALPEFREFQENLKSWIVEPPTPEQLEVVGTHRLFD